MIKIIDTLRGSRAFSIIARILLTFVFWSSGLAKAIDFPGAMAEMQHFGVIPAAPMALAVIFVQLVGAGLVISGRLAWLGCGMLAAFTVLTIPIAHAFWTMGGEAAFIEMMFAFEHVSLIGGLMVAAVLVPRPRAAKTGNFAIA